jgi:hypothetical protein
MEYRKTRKPLVMTVGETYMRTSGAEVECLAFKQGATLAIIRMLISGWTVLVHGPGMYVDELIDWNYSGREYGFLTHDEAVRRCKL